MTVKDFKNLINNLPDNAEIELNTIFEHNKWHTSPVCEAHYDENNNTVYITPEVIVPFDIINFFKEINTNKQKEYMVRVWGGAWNDNANPSIEKDLGIKKGFHYFKTEKEKNEFLKLLMNPIYKNQGIKTDEAYGHMTHKRTIFCCTFKYDDKEFVINYDLRYDYNKERAMHLFVNGSFSCDCTRSTIIRQKYGKNAIPKMDCGCRIEMLDYHFEFLD